MVRFTSSGTEATLMAMRLARAYSGKPAVLKLKGHFHGWHDYAAAGAFRSDAPPVGVPEAVLDTVVVCEAAIEDVLQALDSRSDIGAVIVEAAGALTATLPLPPGFLKRVEAACEERGLVLILDEVVTGFRWSPGGVQQLEGVRPHLTTLAKVLGGGYPGGAVAGRRDLMDILSFPEGGGDWRKTKMGHPGTFNANPLSAAAGVACLQEVADGSHQATAARHAADLRRGLNGILREEGVPGAAYGESSRFRLIFDNPAVAPPNGDASGHDLPAALLEAGSKPSSLHLLNLALLSRGVFLFGDGGFTSSVHDDATLAHTLEAFRSAIRQVKATSS
jgi:glutamate-1-semialdehyde 2,1-aminomutase